MIKRFQVLVRGRSARLFRQQNAERKFRPRGNLVYMLDVPLFARDWINRIQPSETTNMTIVHIGMYLASLIAMVLTFDSPFQIPRRSDGRAQAKIRDRTQEAQIVTLCQGTTTGGRRSIDNGSH